jgi:hypothetical protein
MLPCNVRANRLPCRKECTGTSPRLIKWDKVTILAIVFDSPRDWERPGARPSQAPADESGSGARPHAVGMPGERPSYVVKPAMNRLKSWRVFTEKPAHCHVFHETLARRTAHGEKTRLVQGGLLSMKGAVMFEPGRPPAHSTRFTRSRATQSPRAASPRGGFVLRPPPAAQQVTGSAAPSGRQADRDNAALLYRHPRQAG